jgi:hypothetical protein
MNEIFLDISSDRDRSITKQHIIDLLKKKSDLTGSTLERRARTIRSWFRWIRNNLGIVEVDRYGRITISRQMSLFLYKIMYIYINAIVDYNETHNVILFFENFFSFI